MRKNLILFFILAILTVTVEIKGGKSYIYSAGQPFVEFVNIVQNGINKTDKPVRLIAFYSGIKGKPGTVMVSGPGSRPEIKGSMKYS